MLKVNDTVQVTEDTTSAYSGWRIRKGQLGIVMAVEGDLIQIECEVADDDHAYVKADLLKRVKAPTTDELFKEINNRIHLGVYWTKSRVN